MAAMGYETDLKLFIDGAWKAGDHVLAQLSRQCAFATCRGRHRLAQWVFGRVFPGRALPDTGEPREPIVETAQHPDRPGAPVSARALLTAAIITAIM